MSERQAQVSVLLPYTESPPPESWDGTAPPATSLAHVGDSEMSLSYLSELPSFTTHDGQPLAPANSMQPSVAPSEGTRPGTTAEAGRAPLSSATGARGSQKAEEEGGETALTDDAELPTQPSSEAGPTRPVTSYAGGEFEIGGSISSHAIFLLRQRGHKLMRPLVGSSRRFGSSMRGGASPQAIEQFAALRVIARHAAVYAERHQHRSRWQLMRHLHHVNVTFTLAKLGLRAKLNAEQSFLEEHEHAVGAGWHEQADRDMHDVGVWRRRMMLRKHPLVCEQVRGQSSTQARIRSPPSSYVESNASVTSVTHAWTVHGRPSHSLLSPSLPPSRLCKPAARQLRRWANMIELPCTFEQYHALMVRIYKVLIKPFRAKEAEEAAEEDWQRDVLEANGVKVEKGATGKQARHRSRHLGLRLQRTPFMDAMFELADHWTHSVSGEVRACYTRVRILLSASIPPFPPCPFPPSLLPSFPPFPLSSSDKLFSSSLTNPSRAARPPRILRSMRDSSRCCCVESSVLGRRLCET